MSTPVERSLVVLRDLGYEVERVERNVAAIRRRFPIRVDLFGLADLEAWGAEHTLYVQVCRDADLADHVAKAIHVTTRRLKHDHRPERRSLEALLACRARRFEVWAWGKVGRFWRVHRWGAVDADRFMRVPDDARGTPMGADGFSREAAR